MQNGVKVDIFKVKIMIQFKELITIIKSESTLQDKVGSLIGVTGGASVSVATSEIIISETYFWIRSIAFMVIGTFITFIMPKIWNKLFKTEKHESKKRKY